MKHDGQIALVTGAAAGIGAAIARRLAGEGAKVCIVDKDEPNGRALTETLGNSAIFVCADVGSDNDVEQAISVVKGLYGRLDLLVNNVSSGVMGKVTEVTEEHWIKATDLTLFSIVRTCRHAIPIMTRSTGAIVNIASTAGLSGQYNMACYSSSKAAVINLSRSMALDHAADGIRVNAICPGLVETVATSRIRKIPELWDAYLKRIPMRRAAHADEIASVASFLLSAEASYITGAMLVVDGGNSAWSGQPVTIDYLPAAKP